jgi:hypothetical protein
VSLSSGGAGSGGASGYLLADNVLTTIPMTPNARVALTAFVELFASNDIPITPANMQSCVNDDDCGDKRLESDNVVLTTVIDPAVFSVVRDGAGSVSVGCELITKLVNGRNIVTSLFDTITIKTSSGVAILQKRQGDYRKLAGCGGGVDDDSSVGSCGGTSIGAESTESPVLPFLCRKYHGSFALSSGRVYVLSRYVYTLCA